MLDNDLTIIRLQTEGKAKGKAKERWGKLTEDDLDIIKGNENQLPGKLQERYGYTKEQARREIEQWQRDLR